jgi:hypothetical protein
MESDLTEQDLIRGRGPDTGTESGSKPDTRTQAIQVCPNAERQKPGRSVDFDLPRPGFVFTPRGRLGQSS